MRVMIGALFFGISLFVLPTIGSAEEVWQEVHEGNGVRYEKPNGDQVIYGVQGRAVTREEYVAEGDRIANQHVAFIEQTRPNLTGFEMRPGITEEDARLEQKAAEDTNKVLDQAVADIHADQAKQKAEIMAVKVAPAKVLTSLEKSKE